MAKQEGTVPLKEAREQVAKVCRRLALLHLSFAKTLTEEFGESRGKQLVLKAIKEYGERIGRDAKGRATAQGLDDRPSNYEEDLPLYGMNERNVTVEVNGEKRIRMYGCVMGQVWKSLGEDGLGRLYCYIDPAKYMAFNPGYKLVHVKSLPDGDDYCEFALRPTTEQERKDFAEGKDWSYIDRKE
jgi:hypothetical protein